MSRFISEELNQAIEQMGDDPIRILRALILAADEDFEIDDESIDKIIDKSWAILDVSFDEISAEMDKLLVCKNPEKGLQLLADTEILRYILPELWLQIEYDQDSPHHSLNLWDHTKKVVSLSSDDLIMRWVALLHDIGKPFVRKKNSEGFSSYFMHNKVGAEMARGIACRLKWPSDRTEKVLILIDEHMDDDSPLRQADNCAKL